LLFSGNFTQIRQQENYINSLVTDLCGTDKRTVFAVAKEQGAIDSSNENPAIFQFVDVQLMKKENKSS